MPSLFKAWETQPSWSSPPDYYRDIQTDDAEGCFLAPTTGSVPGQSTKINHQKICLLNNVSTARRTASHPFEMRKRHVIFSVFEKGDSWLIALMCQESEPKLCLFSSLEVPTMLSEH